MAMESPSLEQSIHKLSIAGEQAGFTVETMIHLLMAGLTIPQLIDLINWRLNNPIPGDQESSYHLIM
jgi:hypothetical protein